MSTTTTIHKLIKTHGAPITSPASPTFPPPGFQATGSKWRRGAGRWFTSAAVLLALMLSAIGASAQNNPATGVPTISGDPVRGALLAANITALIAADLAIVPVYTYQWNRHSGGVDTAINGATTASYIPTRDDVGQRITVTVGFTNRSIEPDSRTSVPTAPVTDANTPPTGVPTISGTLIEGRELTVDTSGISDANGPETLSFTYQWNRRSGSTDRAIGGATNRTYTLTQGDVGEMITVTVRYTDANNTNESLTSAPTSAIMANMPPTANAGANQRWDKGTEVTLDGRGSSDPDGNNSDLTYLWSQDAGATVTLSDTTAPQPTFTIPTVIPTTAPASYTFSLVVSDGQASSTNEATVRIFIRPLFRTSIGNQTYKTGNAITDLTLPTALSGPRAVPSTNTYTLAPLPAGLAFDPASRILSGTPTSAGTFDLTYTATNEDGDTDSLAFTITTAANNAPTSSGLAVSIEEDTAHSFGLGEFNFADADGDDLHSLRIDTLPATGSLTLDGAAVTARQVIGVGDIGTLVFTPAANANGDVTFTYSVSDGIDFSATATATVTVTPVNDPPTANAGLNQRWDKGTEVTLDGRGSSDPDGNNSDLTYLWSQDAGATTVTLSDATAPQPRFTIPTVIPTTAPASYTFSLVVSDGQASSTNEATVRIFIRPLFRTSIANQTYSEGNAITALTLPTALSGPGSVPSTNTYTLTSLPAGLAFDSASRILSGTPTSAGTFNLTYTATNEDGDTDSLSFSIEVITPNVPPTADAGADQTVAEGASVTLNGSGDDPDGDNDALTYAWTQVGTPTVTLSGEDTAAPTFTAPADLLTTTSLEFSLTVNDGEDDSQGNTVTITITGVNDPPIANAGADQTVAEGATVTLDGSGSSDSEGENLTYAWTQVGTPMVSLNDADTATPTFTAPADLLNDATLEFSLVVNDGESDSAAATVTITITGVNDPPIADAGPDQNNIAEGASVTLDGSGSSDSDSDNSALTYAWTQVGTATVTLNGADTATPTFTAPADLLTDATLEFSLVVNDGANDSVADSVIIAITGENVAPTANAGPNQRWGKGTEVTLDGTGSTDPDGDNLSYLWSQGTSATTVTLSSTTAAQPTFTIPNVIPEGPALYTFILVVNDGALSSTNHGGSSSTNEATVRIFVRPLFRDTIDTQTYSLGSAITDLILPTAQSGPSSLPSTNTYTLAPLPPGLTFDAASRILSGTPTSAGTSNLTYTATNGDGHTDSLAFSITINAPTNTPPTGLPAISGTTTQGETLTVDTSGISDADGPASLPFTYQWNRRSGSTDTAIGGATSASYILTQDDVGETITVSVRYTDTGNTQESLTSVPTAAVANINDAPTGLPAISGTTTEGETLTADTSGISDADGPASLSFTYQWNRRSGSTDTAIGGATNSTYILTQDDVGEMITVSVRYTDAGNTQESLTSAPTVAVTNTNDAPTGLPTISGTTTEGQTLTADTSGITDADGPASLSFTYQWNRRSGSTDTAIGDATNSTYILTQDDVSETITVTVRYTDAGNTQESLTSVPTAAVANINDAPTGLPTISGTTTEGQTLMANTSGISDADGPASLSFTYQWNRRSGSTDTAIGGATSASYILTQDDVGETITVTVRYTDAGNTSEGPLTSVPTAAVANINDAPTGVPTISGTTTQGQTLTADTSGISDADGPASLPFTYQWNRRSGSTDTAIGGATNSTYILTQDDVGETITVTVRYTDAGNTSEGPLTSAPTAAVANINDAPTGLPTISGTTTQGETLTADTSGITDADGPASLPFTYQWNTRSGSTDTAIGGATSASYILTQDDVGETITVSVRYTDAGNTSEGPLTSVPTAAVTNTNDAPTGLPTISGTTTQGQTLMANTSGISDADGPASLSFTYQWNRRSGSTDTAIGGATSASYILTQDDVSETITVTVRYTDAGNTQESLTSAPTAAVANINDAPTGLPAISGTTTQGETLTVDTSGISDADGPASLSFTYQWNRRSGSTDTAIGGATNSTYILTQDDVGETITVTVRYTDAGNTQESLTSVPTAAVANINDAPTGLPTISGTTTQGETLTVDTSGISDADGPASLSFTYQWNRRSGSTDTAIGGATSASYILTQDDVSEMITVSVRYTDAGNTSEGPLTSAPTAAVANINDAPTGLPTISGTTTQGQTLTADTSGITDADGPASLPFTYQWNTRSGSTDTAIGGATSASYILTQDDVGETITLTVRYTDAGNTSEGPLTSAPTAAVTNTNDAPTGLPTISGTTTQGQTLTADTSGITDADGPASLSFTYQWNRRSGSTDTAISSATNSTYILTQDDVGETITLTVRYTDAGNTSEGPLTSAPTAAVANINDAPTGVPTISGTTTEGETLTADTSGITDADGPASLPFTYQWNTRSGSTDTAIGGATNSTYILTQDDVGETITVTVRYTDAGNTSEGPLTSVPTAAVTNTNDAPTGLPTISGTTTQGQTLTANTGGISDADGPASLPFTYQWNRRSGSTDTAISGATSASYILTQDDVGETITVTVRYTDAGNTSEGPLTSAPTAAVTNTNDAPTGLPTISGTTTEGQTLTANTGGISDADGPASLPFTYQWNRRSGSTDTAIGGATNSTYILTQDDVGETITVTVRYTDAGNTQESLTSAPTVAVTAASTPNNPPSGLPTITGTTTEGQTLTADTSGITDADGPASLSFTYQWNRRSGSTDTAISGETNNTYTLTGADVGEMITVAVRYTDAGNTAEGPLTSVPVTIEAATTTPNNPPSGAVTITGALQVGETLTANTTGISDADGPASLSFTYQWNRHSGGTDTAISGATNSTYTLSGADMGQMITVAVRYTDAGNTAEGPLTSAPTVPVITARPEALDAAEAVAQGVEPARTDSAGTTITLPTSEPVDVRNASTADFEAFTVTSTLDGVDTNHRVIAIRAGSIILEVTPAIPAGSRIMVSYTPPAQGSSSITSRTTGMPLDAIINLPVRAPTSAAFTDLNETILPEVARALADQTVNAITQRIDQVRNGANRSASFAGQSSLAGVATAHGKGMSDGSVDMKAMLGNSGFALPLNATDGTSGGTNGIGGGSLTFWGGADYRDFDGSGNGIDFDGDLFSLQLGVDGKPREDLLIGLAASWSESEVDYRDDSGRGDHQLEIASLHPYASWETRDGLDLWATAGFGQGDLEITGDGQDRASSDVETRTVGAGVGYQLPESSTFRLKGSALLSELEVEGGNGIAALEVNTSLLRMALERSHKQMLSGETYMEPSLEFGARYDGGDGETGFGIELGAGLRYTNPVVGLTLEGNARTLVGRDDYKEWGVSGRILLQAGNHGRGLSFSLKPVYGNVNSSTQALWNEGLRDEADGTARDNTMRMESRLGYGLSAPGGHGLLTPYAEMTSSASTRRYRLGMNWELGSLFDLNLVGERSKNESIDAEHLILLKGVIRL